MPFPNWNGWTPLLHSDLLEVGDVICSDGIDPATALTTRDTSILTRYAIVGEEDHYSIVVNGLQGRSVRSGLENRMFDGLTRTRHAWRRTIDPPIEMLDEFEARIYHAFPEWYRTEAKIWPGYNQVSWNEKIREGDIFISHRLDSEHSHPETAFVPSNNIGRIAKKEYYEALAPGGRYAMFRPIDAPIKQGRRLPMNKIYSSPLPLP